MVANWKVLAGAAVALLLTGYAAGSCGKPSSHDLNAAHDSTSAAVGRLADSERARAALETETRADSLRFAATIDAATQRARAAESRRPQVIDRIVEREAPADTAVARRVAVEVVDSLTEHEIRPLRLALATQDSAYASQGRLLAATDEARLRASEALTAALRERDLLRAARPSWLARNGPRVAIPLAIAGGWYLRGALNR